MTKLRLALAAALAVAVAALWRVARRPPRTITVPGVGRVQVQQNGSAAAAWREHFDRLGGAP